MPIAIVLCPGMTAHDPTEPYDAQRFMPGSPLWPLDKWGALHDIERNILRSVEPISKSIFEEVGLVQRGHTHGKRLNLAENARGDLSVSYARARSKRRLLILR